MAASILHAVLRTHSAPAIIHIYYLKARKAAKGGKPKTVKAINKKKNIYSGVKSLQIDITVSLVNDECAAPWPTQVSLQLNFLLTKSLITTNHTKYPSYKIKKSRQRDTCFFYLFLLLVKKHSQLKIIKNYRYQGTVRDEKRWIKH